MPKFKVVISLGVNSFVVDAKDEDEAIEKAGDSFIAMLGGINSKDAIEVYPVGDEVKV
jgi:hypothetical protein